MDTRQTNRVTMFKTVSAYLDQYNSVWSGLAPLGTAVHQFQDKIAAIDIAAQEQETPTSGAADEKAAAREALEDVLFLACEALAVLAHTGSAHDLLALTASSPSSLRRLGDEELSHRASLVLGEANARKADLVPLHVTQENLDELGQALRDFNTSKTRPRTTVADRIAQTESLPSLIRDASGILRNQVDRLVNLQRRSNSEFVAGYRAARSIIERAATHEVKKAQATAPKSQPPAPAPGL